MDIHSEFPFLRLNPSKCPLKDTDSTINSTNECNNLSPPYTSSFTCYVVYRIGFMEPASDSAPIFHDLILYSSLHHVQQAHRQPSDTVPAAHTGWRFPIQILRQAHIPSTWSRIRPNPYREEAQSVVVASVCHNYTYM